MLKTATRLRVAGHVFARPICQPSLIGALPRLRQVSRATVPPQKRAYSRAAAAQKPLTEEELEKQRMGDAQAEARMADHLNDLFRPLEFPPELAARILTHPSYSNWRVANNNRLTFIGRRVLRTYLALFFASTKTLDQTEDLNALVDVTLETHRLGQYVGPHWGIGRTTRWTLPAVSNSDIGFFKIQGAGVEAVMGGIYHQFGGAVALRVFHTRLLPHLIVPGPFGLPDKFHADAKRILERMGGPNGNLLRPG